MVCQAIPDVVPVLASLPLMSSPITITCEFPVDAGTVQVASNGQFNRYRTMLMLLVVTCCTALMLAGPANAATYYVSSSP